MNSKNGNGRPHGIGWSRLLRMFFAVCVVTVGAAGAQTALPADSAAGSGEQGYRIDQPGTITFTVGVKISGKVEKPQVVIFLPKEKTLYRKEELDRSYKEELDAALPFAPLVR